MKLSDVEEVTGARDRTELEPRLVRFANELGFGRISGALVVDQRVGNRSFSFGNTPPAFQSTWNSKEVGKRDPVMRRLKCLSSPFVYDRDLYVKEHAGDLWEEQAPFGYKTGIALAIHVSPRRTFFVGVDRDDPLPRDEGALARLIADFTLLAVSVQQRASELLEGDVDSAAYFGTLTAQELECLRWRAEGKTAWETGRSSVSAKAGSTSSAPASPRNWAASTRPKRP